MTTFDKIIKACASAWEVTPADILGKCRDQQIASARHYARWLCKTRLGWTSTAIAKRFSCSHGSVLHSCDVVAGWLDINDFLTDCERANIADQQL